MQLPLFAALAAGLFEARGLDVELFEAVPPRDKTLGGLSVRVNAVDSGEADMAITAVPYLLAAQAEGAGTVRSRFVAAFHRRSPIAGIVRGDSEVTEPADLASRPTAAHGMPWMVREYQAALVHNHLKPAPLVDADDGPYAARSLKRGDIEVSPAWIDTIPSIQQNADAVFRTVPLDVSVYATGLLAAERLPTEIVEHFTNALAEGATLQRADPETGILFYNRHCPKASLDYLRVAWAMYQPNATNLDATSMAIDRWKGSVAFYTDAYGLPEFDLQDVCRPEFLGPPAGNSPLPAETITESRAIHEAQRTFKDKTAARRIELSPRQFQVLQFVAAGLSARQIARHMGLKEPTVRNHVRKILDKLEAHSQVEAVAFARRLGLIDCTSTGLRLRTENALS